MPTNHLEVLRQFRVLIKSIKWHFDSIEDSCQISGAQLWALAEVSSRPDLRVSDLAKAMAVHQSTASNLADKLVQMGLVIKERKDLDQRVVRLQPTEAGLRVVAQAPQPLEGVLPSALKKLQPQQLKELNHLLGELISLMETPDKKKAAATPLSDI